MIHTIHPEIFNIRENIIYYYVFLGIIAIFFVTLLSTFRWKYLLEEQYCKAFSFKKLLKLHWASQFYGLFFIGTIGGDISRTYLLTQEEKNHNFLDLSKMTFIDRMYSLLGIAIIPILFYFLLMDFLFFFAIVAFLFFSPSIRKVPFFISIFAHLIKIVLLLVGGWLFTKSYSIHSTFYFSLSILIESIPISWQGLGLGHLAFHEVNPVHKYSIIIYSHYFISKILFKLLGGYFVIQHQSKVLFKSFENK